MKKDNNQDKPEPKKRKKRVAKKKPNESRGETNHAMGEAISGILKKQNPTIEELIKSQIYLYQFCQNLTLKMHEMEIHMQQMNHHMMFMSGENENLKKILDMIGGKFQELKKNIKRPPSDIGKPSYLKKDDIDFDEEDDDEDSDIEVIKEKPLHDDVTIDCRICGNIYHKSNSKCPECGYTKNKKGR